MSCARGSFDCRPALAIAWSGDIGRASRNARLLVCLRPMHSTASHSATRVSTSSSRDPIPNRPLQRNQAMEITHIDRCPFLSVLPSFSFSLVRGSTCSYNIYIRYCMSRIAVPVLHWIGFWLLGSRRGAPRPRGGGGARDAGGSLSVQYFHGTIHICTAYYNLAYCRPSPR